MAQNLEDMQNQYESYMYPEPIVDLSPYKRFAYDKLDPTYLEHVYWPSNRPTSPKILCAGCGSNQAAAVAFSNPDATVLGIDLSRDSLAHENYLKEKYELANLELRNLNLLEVNQLSDKFDLIISAGVLHHNERRVEILKQFKEVLNPKTGVISLMLYGKYLRAGVYILQDLFTRLGVPQNSEGIQFIRETIDSLPKNHLIFSYDPKIAECEETEIVDHFLHSYDVAFTVEDVLAFKDAAGLIFQGWENNIYYYPDGCFPSNHPMFKRLKQQEDVNQWSAMEAINPLGKHIFFLTHPDRPSENYQLDFNGDRALDMIVHTHPLVTINSESNIWRMQRPGNPPRNLAKQQYEIVSKINGKITIRECLQKSGYGVNDATVKEVLSYFDSLWRSGLLQFSW